jgi:hypothetical protein
MENALINRNGIVKKFIKEKSNFELSLSQSNTKQTVIINDDGKFEIVRILETDEIIFNAVMHCTVMEEEYKPGFATPGGGGYVKVPNVYEQKIEVMRYHNGSFSMINAGSNDNWIKLSYVSRYKSDGTLYNAKELTTNLNMKYKVLPDSEESHFQRTTTDGLILDLEQCLDVESLVEFVKMFGSQVQATPDIKVCMYF